MLMAWDLMAMPLKVKRVDYYHYYYWGIPLIHCPITAVTKAAATLPRVYLTSNNILWKGGKREGNDLDLPITDTIA